MTDLTYRFQVYSFGKRYTTFELPRTPPKEMLASEWRQYMGLVAAYLLAAQMVPEAVAEAKWNDETVATVSFEEATDLTFFHKLPFEVRKVAGTALLMEGFPGAIVHSLIHLEHEK